MAVDYDDMVSNKLAGYVAENPQQNGWFFDEGYLYSPGSDLSLYKPNFFLFCGTSHIINAQLLKIPKTIEESNDARTARWFGSHIFVKKDMDASQTPLSRLPFIGSVYRVGHIDATSQSNSVSSIAKPADTRIPLSQELVDEYFGGAHEPPA